MLNGTLPHEAHGCHLTADTQQHFRQDVHSNRCWLCWWDSTSPSNTDNIQLLPMRLNNTQHPITQRSADPSCLPGRSTGGRELGWLQRSVMTPGYLSGWYYFRYCVLPNVLGILVLGWYSDLLWKSPLTAIMDSPRDDWHCADCARKF